MANHQASRPPIPSLPVPSAVSQLGPDALERPYRHDGMAPLLVAAGHCWNLYWMGNLTRCFRSGFLGVLDSNGKS
jgi:hypothetical protein